MTKDKKSYLWHLIQPRDIFVTINLFHHHQVVTDQNPQDIALMTVREKFLDAFKNEIPYNLKFRIEHWDLSEEGRLMEEILGK